MRFFRELSIAVCISALLPLLPAMAAARVTRTSALPQVEVQPAAVSLAAGASQQFQANVLGGTSQDVTWVVNGVPGGAPSLGTITPGGLYTAPANAPKPMNLTISAVAAAAPMVSGAATASVDIPHYGGRTYYVATTGSDSAIGTSADQAWRTIQHAVAMAEPGATILVASGTYGELVTITRSGSPSLGYITLAAAPGADPVIDGKGLPLPNATQGLITLDNVRYVRVVGFELRNYTSNSADLVPAGLYITGSGDHIEILGNHIHDISTTVADSTGDAFGLAVYGNAASPITDLIIDGNELDKLATGSSESLTINGNVQNWQVTNNLVHDDDNIGIDAIGFEGTAPANGVDQARNGWIAYNNVYNISSATNPSYNYQPSADGIYVDGGTQIVIENNIVKAADLGIEVTSEHKGHVASNVTVRNNLVFHSNIAGISIGGYDANRGGTVNCAFVNNTLFENDVNRSGGGEFQIQYYASGNIFSNNVLYGNDQGLLVNSYVAQAAPASLRDNLYFGSNGAVSLQWKWNGQSYASYADYAKANPGDMNAVIADPLFVDMAAPNLQLKSGSPAFDAAANLGLVLEGVHDFAGAARVDASGLLDIGAYQHQVAAGSAGGSPAITGTRRGVIVTP